jgi:hypothetical protein
MAFLAENIPETDGKTAPFIAFGFKIKLPDPVRQFSRGFAGHGHAGKIALDVGQENGNAKRAESLGHCLQAHALACACRAANQSMAVGHGRQDADFLFAGKRDQGFFIII